MSKISIKEQRSQINSDGFAVTVSFDDSDEFEGITVHDPLSAQSKAKLEWHFEQYVNYPYLEEVEPQEAEKIIREEGENLFSQLFSQPQIYNRYREAIRGDLKNLVVEISGSPEFHSLHWEALKDINLPRPFVLDALILRKDTKLQNLPADIRETTTINLLIVTSRPAGRRDVGYRTISRPLVELLRNSRLPVKVHILRPATYESLDKHLDEVDKGFYHVIHFDVHGALLNFEDFKRIEKEKTGNNLTFQIQRYGRSEIQPYEGKDAFLFFDLYSESESRDDDGFRADPVRANELASLLLMHGIPLIILNACQSAKELGEQDQKGVLPIAEETSLASRLMRAGAQMVLAMSYSVTVTAAEILMKSLYQEIFRGKTLQQAIQLGRRELANRKQRRAAFNFQVSLEDWLLPVVYQKQKVELKTKTLTPQEEEELLLAKEEIGKMPEVEYGFHGRDIDILNIERRILLKNNILLIRGMGGAGKTTLLRHLAWWWKATDFIKKVFYFGYDEKAYTRQEIMVKIAEDLYDKFAFATFQAMDERAQMQKLVNKLRNERHLLIFDNLESIQGGFFAVKNTLPPAEQVKLKDFIAEVRGTDDAFQEQTIVLFGSRSAEEWLADMTFRKNLYDLGGLDKESATQFAEEILRQNEVLKYRNDEDFKKLLKLLAGFPLPMKVIFENLKRQSPTQVLDALKAGDIDLNTGTAEEKTSDILKCIEYSHSNITPEKQELLLCLAPFTSVVNRMYFEHYIEELKKHEALAHLQHELWNEVFTESIQRGLMSQEEDLPIIHLQPILPFFLKTQWQEIEMPDFRQNIQMAFREYFNIVSFSILGMMKSMDSGEQQLGQFLASLEFENIDTCLEHSFNLQSSFLQSYLALSFFYDITQNQKAGLKLGTKVVDRLKDYPPETLKDELGLEMVFVLYDIALRYFRLNDYENSVNAFQNALNLLGDTKNIKTEQKKFYFATIYKDVGNLWFEIGKWQEASQFYKDALKIYGELNKPNEQTSIMYNLGVLAAEQKKWEEAEKCYISALDYYIDVNKEEEQAPIYHGLGMIYIEKQDLQKATNYFERALEIFAKFQDAFQQINTIVNLGSLALNFNEYEKAEDYYRSALQISIDIDDDQSQAVIFGTIGSLKRKQGKFSEARNYLLKSLKLTTLNGGFRGQQQLLTTHINLARLWKEIDDDSLLLEVADIFGNSESEVRDYYERIYEKVTDKNITD